MSPVPAPATTSAGGWITLYAELPALNLDLSANTDHSGLLDLVRMTP
jgi:hypothetical protein